LNILDIVQVEVAILKDMATNYVQLTKGATGVKMDTKQEHKSPGSDQEASNCSEKLASLEQQHEKCIAELEQARAECAQLQTANKQLDEKHNELVARELKVRTMAKKYKLAVGDPAGQAEEFGTGRATQEASPTPANRTIHPGR
jgi:uncharacterized protein (DUF3084 family)